MQTMEGDENFLWVRQASMATATQAKEGWEEVRMVSGLRPAQDRPCRSYILFPSVLTQGPLFKKKESRAERAKSTAGARLKIMVTWTMVVAMEVERSEWI